MEEPSVLDYLKARLMPWRGPLPRIPVPEQPDSTLILAEGDSVPAPASGIVVAGAPALQPLVKSQVRASVWPWLSLGSLALALLAQISLEPGQDRAWRLGLILYLFSLGCLVVASWRGEWVPAPLPEAERRIDPLTVRVLGLFAGILLALLAFLTLSGNEFTPINVTLWLLSVLLNDLGFLAAGGMARSCCRKDAVVIHYA